MAITVFAQDAKTFAAKWLRRLPYLLLSEGVVLSPQWATPLKVQQAATPNMSVDVLGGDCIVQGEAEGGTYFTNDYGSMIFTNDATQNLAISAAHATLNRKDIVIAHCYDDNTSGGSKGLLEVVTGTAASSPSPPAVPANSYQLAEVYVGAAVSSITNANITDKRLPAYLNQGMAAAMRAYISGGTPQHTSSGNYQTVPLNAVAFDVLGSFNTSNYRFTVPTAGTYQINGLVSFGSNTNGIRIPAICVNGGEVTIGNLGSDEGGGSGSGSRVDISDVLKLAANDYVELRAYQNSGSNLNYNTGSIQCYLSIHQLSRSF